MMRAGTELTATAQAVIARHRVSLDQQLADLADIRDNRVGPVQAQKIRRAVGRMLTRAGEALIADATKAIDEPRRKRRIEILEAEARGEKVDP